MDQINVWEELKKRIGALADLSAGDKTTWLARIDLIPFESADFLLGTVEESPELILKINDDMKKKEAILAKGDMAEWQEIIDKERSALESLMAETES